MQQTDKQKKVKLLLLSMSDYIPSPKGATAQGAAPGPQASSFVKCDDCRGCGRSTGTRPCYACLTCPQCQAPRRDEPCEKGKKCKGLKIKHPNHGCRMCGTCAGHGARKRKLGEKQEAEDAYSGMTMSDLEKEMSKSRASQGKRRLTLSEELEDEFQWVRRSNQYREQGSYDVLEANLRWLRDRHIGEYEILMHWTTEYDNLNWVWPPRVLVAIEEIIGKLADRMPDPVKVPKHVLEYERRRAA